MDITADCNQAEKQNGNGGHREGTRGPTETRITARALISLLESQGYECAETGRKLTPEVAALDHKRPLSRGGENSMENVQVVHRDVNAAKASMIHDQFVAMCREVVEHQCP